MKKPSDIPGKIDSYNQRAWKLRHGNPQDALHLSREALHLSKKYSYPKGIASSLLCKSAASFFLALKNEKIAEDLNTALRYFEETGDFISQTRTLNITGNLYDSYGDYDKGLQLCQKALRISEENELAEEQGDILSTLGHLYTRTTDYDNALSSYLKALKIRETLNDMPAMASSLNLIARTHTLKKDYKTALRFYYKSLRLREEIKDTGAIPWTHLGLASLYEKLEKFDKAKIHFNAALEMNRKPVDKRLQIQCLLGSGRICAFTGKEKQGVRLLNKAVSLAKSLHAKPLLYEGYRALAAVYEKTGNPLQALENYKLYQKIKDEVHSAETSNRLKQLQVGFAVERSEKEAEIYRLKNVELKAAYQIIEEKNQDITDSIQYASRIQQAILVPQDVIRQSFSDFFIFFRPKDIVSGDFYYFGKTSDWIVFAAVDCTGHGVPGALMSMIGNSLLNEIIADPSVTNAAMLLKELDRKLICALNPSGLETGVKDGMEVSAMTCNLKTNVFQLAGAGRDVLMVQDGKKTVIEGTSYGIGDYRQEEKKFDFTEFSHVSGAMIYLCSDGFEDQFGGTDDKKFKSKRLEELLISIASQPVHEQKDIVEKTFDEWKGSGEQTDDVTVIGVRI